MNNHVFVEDFSLLVILKAYVHVSLVINVSKPHFLNYYTGFGLTVYMLLQHTA